MITMRKKTASANALNIIATATGGGGRSEEEGPGASPLAVDATMPHDGHRQPGARPNVGTRKQTPQMESAPKHINGMCKGEEGRA